MLDGTTVVPEVASKPVAANGKTTLTADWTNPVLWGSGPYGEPKLYTLRTELIQGDKVIDRTFTRFGFREVWLSGRDVMLNGKKLWLVGTYHSKHSPLRELNDRRPLAAMNRAMQTAGLNTLHGHWDDLGRPWLEVCDEMGMFVVAGFSCDGRPQIQSKADAGWADWMTAACAEWCMPGAISVHSPLATHGRGAAGAAWLHFAGGVSPTRRRGATSRPVAAAARR